jgi:hypothetical protein
MWKSLALAWPSAEQSEVYSMSGGGAKELRACSACAGDYEDPDRTAWTADADNEEGDDAPSAIVEEFPADE